MTSVPASPPAPAADRLPTLALVTVACATFISVTIEMLPTGLMHLMAPDLKVSNALIGLLMTVFAFTVVLTSTPITHLTRALPRHALLIAVLVVFALGSIGTAIAPTYELVVATRILTGLAHGVFWAVVASYTALISPPQLLTKAVSITLGGGSAAYVLGVPIGTFLGQLFGWRLTFGLLAGLALVVSVMLWRLLPRVDHRVEADAAAEPEPMLEVQPAPTGPIAIVTEFGRRDDDSASDASRGRGASAAGASADASGSGAASGSAAASAVPEQSLSRVVTLCVLTAVIMLAQYAAYSYISPYVIDVIGIPEVALSLVLFGYGAASALGTLTTGVLFGTRRTLGFVVTFALLLTSVGVLAFAPPVWLAIVALIGWGVGMGFMPPLLQTTLLLVAPPRIRDVSSALYTSGFNIGIGGGALVGGIILNAAGIGWIMPFFIVVVSAAFIAYLVIVARRARA